MLRTPEPNLVAEISGLIPSDNSTVSVSRPGEMGRRIGGSAGRRPRETDLRNGVSSINDEKTEDEDELEDDYDFGTKGEQLAAPWDHDL